MTPKQENGLKNFSEDETFSEKWWERNVGGVREKKIDNEREQRIERVRVREMRRGEREREIEIER